MPIILFEDAEMTTLGRPDDKCKYVHSVLTTLNSSLGTNEFGHMDEDLHTALEKLNAKELITLNTYIAKQNRMSVEQAVSLLPTTTPAQKRRVDQASELYQKLEIKNASDTTETNARTNTESGTESAEFTVRQ